VADLDDTGYLTATREGRRNPYQIDRGLPLRYPPERDHQIREILGVLTDNRTSTQRAATSA
jgi:hypothetical protein